MNHPHAKWLIIGLLSSALLLGQSSLLAQDCNGSITATAPDSRYINHNNGTVTDTQTKLEWKQCSEGLTRTDCSEGTATKYSWQAALQQAQNVNNSGGFAGHRDWRLPNRNELASLVERSCYNPSINATLFPNTFISDYWSASPRTTHTPGTAWGVNFTNGEVQGDSMDSVDNYVRLVRGGQ